jgi:hypothetical protein
MPQRAQQNKVATRKEHDYRKNRKIRKESKKEIKLRKTSKATLVIKKLEGRKHIEKE